MRASVPVALLLAVAATAGADEAHYRVTAAFAARIESGEHSGLTIGLERDERGPLVSVSQVAGPLGAVPSYPLADSARCGDTEALAVPAAFSLPRDAATAVTASRSSFDAFVRVVAWVSRHTTLDESDREPQDAISVLLRARGRCSGRANLAVGMLRAAGIPARVVHGVLFEGGRARWHRWGEAWLGSLGWLPFDPGASAGVVSVRYLPCRALVPGLQPQGVALESIDEAGFGLLPRRSGLVTPLLRGVNLHCAAPEGVTGITAILVGPDGTRWVRRGAAGVAFESLQPGRYWLTWRSSELMVAPVSLDLRRHGDVSITLGARRREQPPDGSGPAPEPAGGSDS